jgi:hypothetical protein
MVGPEQGPLERNWLISGKTRRPRCPTLFLTGGDLEQHPRRAGWGPAPRVTSAPEEATMEGTRFDTITKALTLRRGRRAVLRRIAGGTVLALVGATQPALSRATSRRCPAGQRRCPGSRGACVDLQTDPKNCGACGNDCSTCHSCGGECCAGVCGLCFAAGQICCQGSYCVNPFTDPENCGGCGVDDPVHVCAAGEICCGGSGVCSIGGGC